MRSDRPRLPARGVHQTERRAGSLDPALFAFQGRSAICTPGALRSVPGESTGAGCWTTKRARCWNTGPCTASTNERRSRMRPPEACPPVSTPGWTSLAVASTRSWTCGVEARTLDTRQIGLDRKIAAPTRQDDAECICGIPSHQSPTNRRKSRLTPPRVQQPRRGLKPACDLQTEGFRTR